MFGVDGSERLVHVDQVTRGKTTLACPYCGGPLLARKGKVLGHHFAHADETCREVGGRAPRTLAVPLYERFLDLPGRVWRALQGFKEDGYYHPLLEHHGLVRANDFTNWYDLTTLGKIPFAEASLSTFAEVQNQQILEKHRELEATVRRARGIRFDHDPSRWRYEPRPEQVATALTDLSLYRQQLKRLLSATLYLFEIKHGGGILYKIGVTSRGLEERMEEVKRDLSGAFGSVAVHPLRALAHRGSVERYALQRYRKHRVQLGSLSEYFAFEDRRRVLADFTRLGDKALEPWEAAILAGEPSEVAREVQEEAREGREEKATSLASPKQP